MKLKNIYLIFIKEEKNCRNSSFSYWLLYYYSASLQAEWTENPWLSKMIIVFVVPNKYGMKDWTTATRVVEVFFHNKTNLLQLSPRCSFACPSFLKILCNKYMTFQILPMKSILHVNYIALCWTSCFVICKKIKLLIDLFIKAGIWHTKQKPYAIVLVELIYNSWYYMFINEKDHAHAMYM